MKKEKKPVLEMNLNLVPLLEALGMSEALDKLIESAQKGKIDVLDKLTSKIQRGEADIRVTIGKKKKKIPIVLSVRLKK